MIDKKVIYKKISYILNIGLFFIMIIFLYSPFVKSDNSSMIVSVEPSSQVVFTENNFNIEINCSPISPIKAYEFKLSFDPSLIQANTVTEGNIFNGYSTFFNPGTIDNVNGTIVNIYGLILGEGNVSSAGCLASISFTSKSNLGSSNITLYDVGITNETCYLPVINLSGNVIVNHINSTHILIEGESPVNQSVNVNINTSSLNVLIRNPTGNPFYFELISNPDVGSFFSDNASNGTKSCNISGLSYHITYNWFVNCMDLATFNWTNNSYWFTTKNNIPPVNDNPSGGGGFVVPNNNINQLNNPPFKPSKAVGPVYIKINIVYEYSSSSYDNNSDMIRYKFDWGDGSFSNWSEYVVSNETISMNHSWVSKSNYDIRVICQDENGVNSSWSDYLRVVVSGSDSIVLDPVADFIYSIGSGVSNKFILFNASNSFDPDGVIVSYIWNFGDGESGKGITCSHLYKKPGLYVVNLVLTDNNGNVINKSYSINMGFKVRTEGLVNSGGNSKLPYYLICIVSIFFVSLIYIFRSKFEKFIINHHRKKIKNLEYDLKMIKFK